MPNRVRRPLLAHPRPTRHLSRSHAQRHPLRERKLPVRMRTRRDRGIDRARLPRRPCKEHQHRRRRRPRPPLSRAPRLGRHLHRDDREHERRTRPAPPATATTQFALVDRDSPALRTHQPQARHVVPAPGAPTRRTPAPIAGYRPQQQQARQRGKAPACSPPRPFRPRRDRTHRQMVNEATLPLVIRRP